MLGIRRYLRFDAPLRRFLGRRRSRYPPRGTERLFRRVASSSGFVSSAGLPLLAFQKPTGLDQDDAARLYAFDCDRRMRPPNAAIRAVRLITAPASSAAPAQAAEPAILTPVVPARHMQPSVPRGRSPPRLP